MFGAFLLSFIPFAWLFGIYGTKFENEEFVIPKWQFYMQAVAYFLMKIMVKMSHLQGVRTDNLSAISVLFGYLVE